MCWAASIYVFRLHAMVEQFDLSQFEQAYGAEGRLAYPPGMMLKVWLYAFCWE